MTTTTARIRQADETLIYTDSGTIPRFDPYNPDPSLYDSAEDYDTALQVHVALTDLGAETYGAEFVPEDEFIDYTEQVIHDCYDVSGLTRASEHFDPHRWPYCHITIDYEAAARDLRHDYTPVTIDGVDYLVREA